MDLGWGFWLSSALGAMVGMTLETIFGVGRRFSTRVVRRFKAARRFARMGDQSELIRRGDEELLVVQRVREGWDPQRITFIERKRELALADVLHELADSDLPAPARELLTAVQAERERLESSPDGEWNGESIAVEHFSTRSRTNSDKEDPILRLTVSRSDHAAHAVISNAWSSRFEQHGTFGRDLDGASTAIPGMIHAIGLNATLVTSDNKVIIARRSANASSGRNGRHISVNEGMKFSDRTDGRLDPHVGLVRGVKEELGIDIDVADVSIHTIMLDLRRYQLGLLAHIDLRNSNISASDILDGRKFGAAVDKFENRSIEAIPWTKKSVENALRATEWVAHGWLNLLLSGSNELGLDFARVVEDARRDSVVSGASN